MKVFIAGPRTLSALNKEVKERLNNISNNKLTVLVGDANGVDKSIQKYFFEKKYDKVIIYATNGIARNNIGKWGVVKVDVPSSTKGFNYYAAKDMEMANAADYGFMIWNGQSKGTLNNIINLIDLKKKVLVYFTPDKKFYTLTSLSDINELISKCDVSVHILFEELLRKEVQLTLGI